MPKQIHHTSILSKRSICSYEVLTKVKTRVSETRQRYTDDGEVVSGLGETERGLVQSSKCFTLHTGTEIWMEILKVKISGNVSTLENYCLDYKALLQPNI